MSGNAALFQMKLNTFSKGIKEHGFSVTRRANGL